MRERARCPVCGASVLTRRTSRGSRVIVEHDDIEWGGRCRGSGRWALPYMELRDA